MPTFGTASTAHLASCHPDLQRLFRTVVEFYDCSVICGHRSHAEQARLFAARPQLTKARPGQSPHNPLPALATDVVPYPIDWRDLRRAYHFAGFVKAVALDLGITVRWGGDWYGELARATSGGRVRHSFNDLPHWELPFTPPRKETQP